MERRTQSQFGRGDRRDRRPGQGGPGSGPDAKPEFDTKVVDIARVAKVIKGGRRFAFRALMVVGDNNGRVGLGTGKARSVQDAIKKATERARNNMQAVNMVDNTIAHEVVTKHGGSVVMLRPASPGTGIIAGGGVRAVLQAAGIKDVLTKQLGSSSRLNSTFATLKGLQQLKNLNEEARRRGKDAADVQPFWRRANVRSGQQ